MVYSKQIADKSRERNVIRAEYSGFCFGVKRAMEIAERTLTEAVKQNVSGEAVVNRSGSAKTDSSSMRVFSHGPLIHNETAVAELEKKGLHVIDDLNEAEAGDTVIIRAHGEPKSFYEEAEKRGIRLIDATCPFVEKIHRLVCADDSDIVIVGSPEHPEVIGINGWADDNAAIISSMDEARGLAWLWGTSISSGDISMNRPVLIVAQTTSKQEFFTDVTETLLKTGRSIKVENTICSATKERQDAAAELAGKVDAMLVIGSSRSSNSRKLYEIASKYCENTFFVENIDELSLLDTKKYNKIGIAAGASTPESVIQEVIATMSEKFTENAENQMMDFMDEIEASLRLPRSGEIVNGKVLQATEKEVIVNLGCKKDGILPKEEVSLEEGQSLSDLFKEGDEIQAKVIRTDDGEIILSKKKLEINEHWDEVAEALENKSVINVKITRAVNGGVIAAYKEVSGFIPMSQLSDKYVESADEFIGQTMDVKVNRVDRMKGRAVFSHKAVLADERAAKIAEIWEKLSVGDVVEGTVMRFTDYGAFVDIGGIDGLLHISEISWGKLKHPQEVLAIGQKIKVVILQMNAEKGKISLGYKQNQPEPWSVINEKYAIGQVVEGKVVQIKEYGAFVELEPGLDGLVHISEVAHKRVTNIADEISQGQMVQAQILDIDTEKKRISLSLKACIEPPAEEAAPAEEAPAEDTEA